MTRDEVRDRFINRCLSGLDKEKRRVQNSKDVNNKDSATTSSRIPANASLYVRHIGELTDETAKDKQKPIRKKAGK
jgi:hypothetical protein